MIVVNIELFGEFEYIFFYIVRKTNRKVEIWLMRRYCFKEKE